MGDKKSNNASETADHLAALLASLIGVVIKKMFDGYGIFLMDKMFGFEDGDRARHSKMPCFALHDLFSEDQKSCIAMVQQTNNLTNK